MDEWKIQPASPDLQLHLQLTERVKKLEIQINCLRKQVLDIEGKKSYTEQAREYAKDRENG